MSVDEERRSLVLEAAARRVGLRPNAEQSARILVDWEDVDVDDQAAVERALWSVYPEHLFRFGAADIGAGARDYSGELARRAPARSSELLAAAYDEVDAIRQRRRFR
jgi:hypothetical protein